ncbi:putative membrane protein [Ralstonia insidiosa]|uniref:Membrane protein n=1 Tax=Ralstonia insidiosa TaxID=190721 RepID=A0AAC9BJ47_9RALS|nr:hypothetical protein [Ralstonia insidiosa]ANH74801.1 putative membrane protein [Ralstonia insidiosa]
MNGNIGKKVAVGMALTVGAAGAAMAQTASGPDLSSIISAVAIGTVSAGIVSMGAVKIVPNVTKWAVNKLVGFFR